MKLKRKEFKWEDFDEMSKFASRIGKDNIANIQVYGLQLKWLVLYWE